MEYKPFIKNAKDYSVFIEEILGEYIVMKKKGFEIEKISKIYFEKCLKGNIVKVPMIIEILVWTQFNGTSS